LIKGVDPAPDILSMFEHDLVRKPAPPFGIMS
jgi:hypothetical protein